MRNIGNVLKSAKRYEQAESTYQQVVQAYRELGDRVNEASSINCLGLLEEDRQHWDTAIAHYEQARQVFDELKQPANVAVIFHNFAHVYIGAKRYVEANEAHEKAATIYRELGDQAAKVFDYQLPGKYRSGTTTMGHCYSPL